MGAHTSVPMLHAFRFDTFTGLPESWGWGPFEKGMFSQGGHLPPVAPNAKLIKGCVQDSTPARDGASRRCLMAD